MEGRVGVRDGPRPGLGDDVHHRLGGAALISANVEAGSSSGDVAGEPDSLAPSSLEDGQIAQGHDAHRLAVLNHRQPAKGLFSHDLDGVLHTVTG